MILVIFTNSLQIQRNTFFCNLHSKALFQQLRPNLSGPNWSNQMFVTSVYRSLPKIIVKYYAILNLCRSHAKG